MGIVEETKPQVNGMEFFYTYIKGNWEKELRSGLRLRCGGQDRMVGA